MIKDSGDRTRVKRAEVWKPVVGYEDLYEVSSIGRIRSLRKNTRIADKKDRIMRQKHDNKGYLRVNLHKNKRCKSELVSRLVALAFIPNPEGLPQVGHNNDDKENNTVENLYWTSAAENLTHNNLHLRIRDKRQESIQKVIDALSTPVIATNQTTGEEHIFESMQAAQRAGKGFKSAKISLCCAGKRKSHKGYMWRKIYD